MALKDKWVDKINGVDINSADDINQVAHAVMELEKNSAVIIDKIIDPDNNPLSVTEDSVLDIPMEVGGLSTSSGEPFERDDAIRSSDFIFVTPNETIQFASNLPVGGSGKIRVCCYGEDKTFIKMGYPTLQTDFHIESDWHYIKFYRSDTGDGQVTMSIVRKGEVEKAEFKKIYFADHGYSVYGGLIGGGGNYHKLVIQADENEQDDADPDVHTILELAAPKNNPKEATLALMNAGDGVEQFVDFSSMVYDPDNPTVEIVNQTRGGHKLPEFSIRYNDGKGAGRVKKFTIQPDAIPIELTAQGLKVRKNNNFNNTGTDEEYIIVNLWSVLDRLDSVEQSVERLALATDVGGVVYSPNGTKFKITVSNDGVLTATRI